MKKEKIMSHLQAIYAAAGRSGDAARCMIAPSPKVRAELKRELERLKALSDVSILEGLLTPKQRTSVGLNDGMVMPGNAFPLGTSASAVRSHERRHIVSGEVRVAVVLVDFPDRKMIQMKEHYEELFFSDAKGSVRSYFKEVSGGAVLIEGEVVGPITLPKKLKLYANGASGMGDTFPNARTMAYDTAKAVESLIDFENYDNDHDDYVDAFVIVHAGRGSEDTANKHDLWSHKWLLPKEIDTGNVNLYAYLTVPEDCKLGVCAHELGHLLFGFPDLYGNNSATEGVGDWCLMGSGSWNDDGNTPAHPSAWCKVHQRWAIVVNQAKNADNVKIEPVQQSKTVYRLWKEGLQGHEYFLLENRQQNKFDKFIPGSGLLVWHVDENVDNNDNELHYKVALVQADGQKDLEKGNNRGDAGDAYPGAAGNTTFNKTTRPHSLSYGGIDTGVQVNNIREEGQNIIANLQVSNRKSGVPKKKKKPVRTERSER